MSWRTRAVCRDEDPELFFPTGSQDPGRAQLVAAKRVCARCPVAADCLSWAMDNGDLEGIWGGTTEDERRDLACAGGSATR